jgi:hypothetical protein
MLGESVPLPSQAQIIIASPNSEQRSRQHDAPMATLTDYPYRSRLP